MKEKSIDKVTLEEWITKHLKSKLVNVVALVVPEDKKVTVESMFSGYTIELYNSIIDKTAEETKELFKPFVNNIMSVVECMGLTEKQLNSLKRLLKNEIYACLSSIVLPMCKK